MRKLQTQINSYKFCRNELKTKNFYNIALNILSKQKKCICQ